MKKLYCIIWVSIENWKKPKISYLLKNTLVLSIIRSKCNEDEKLFRGKKSIEILKSLCSIENI